MTPEELDSAIRRVPDFPKPGVGFYDITSILANPAAFAHCISGLCKIVSESGANALAAIEARGFVFASVLAQQLFLPLVLVRKKGKLPNTCQCQNFDLEYGSDTVCVQDLDLVQGRRFFLVDDLIATGGTLAAACLIIERAGLDVAGIGAIIGLPFLGYEKALHGHRVSTLINFQDE